jgi:hypothetical protein
MSLGLAEKVFMNPVPKVDSMVDRRPGLRSQPESGPDF